LTGSCAFDPHLVRIQFHKRQVEMVRNGVEVIGEEVGQEAGDRNRASLMGLGRADDQPTVNFGGGRRTRQGLVGSAAAHPHRRLWAHP